MTLTLYYAPKTRAHKIAVLLEELGVEWTKKSLDLSKKEHKVPDYLALHPHGLVPALTDGDTVVFESAAIALYLADKYPEKGLAPLPSSPERGAYLTWMFYSVATLEPPLINIHLEKKKPVEQQSAQVIEEAGARFKECARVLTRVLEKQPFMLSKFSAADIMINANVGWGKTLGQLDGFEVLENYLVRLRGRPAVMTAGNR